MIAGASSVESPLRHDARHGSSARDEGHDEANPAGSRALPAGLYLRPVVTKYSNIFIYVMLAGAHPAPKEEEEEKTFGGTRPGREDIMKVKGSSRGSATRSRTGSRSSDPGHI